MHSIFIRSLNREKGVIFLFINTNELINCLHPTSQPFLQSNSSRSLRGLFSQLKMTTFFAQTSLNFKMPKAISSDKPPKRESWARGGVHTGPPGNCIMDLLHLVPAPGQNYHEVSPQTDTCKPIISYLVPHHTTNPLEWVFTVRWKANTKLIIA